MEKGGKQADVWPDGGIYIVTIQYNEKFETYNHNRVIQVH